MTRIERLMKRRDELRQEWMTAMRTAPMKASAIKRKLDVAEQAVEEAEAYMPRRLGEMIDSKTLDESGLCNLLIETHLAADYFCDCAGSVRVLMDKLGFADCSLYPMIKEMERLSAEYAKIVCHPEFAGLQDLMVTNEDLIDKLHDDCNGYIKKHLKINYLYQNEKMKGDEK